MIKPLTNKTYIYQNRTYIQNSFQQEVFQKIKSLTDKDLHYITLQQTSDPNKRNLNLKELKNFIRRGIRKYFAENHPSYYLNIENELVKYFCVFETNQNFNHNQNKSMLKYKKIFLGLHFHLFISSPDHLEWFSIQDLSNRIKWELRSLKHKRDCISKYELTTLETLSDTQTEKETNEECSLIVNYTSDFIRYHTKQFYKRPSIEMVLTNF
jgi:hypothetical protein